MMKEFYYRICRVIEGIKNDCSFSAIVAGGIAVLVSYAGPILIVFQAAKIAGLTDSMLSSWIWAISFSAGITGAILSYWFKIPIIAAWSTPGAVLLVASWSIYPYSDAIGAFVLSGLIATVLGISGIFSSVIKRIPQPIIAAMLAGILLKFGVEVFISLKELPILAVPMILCYLGLKRWYPRYAVAATLFVGIIVASHLNLLHFEDMSISLVTPIFVKPTVSMEAFIGLGIPLCIVTMTAQNATGIGLLKADGYDAPISPIVTATGILSVLFAPFGSHGINIAAITAAICTGKEAHTDSDKRYIAGISCGLLYMLVSIFGATIVSVFSVFPKELIATIAGLALFGSIISSLSSAMSEELQKESALITFLVTISGISILGVGAAFWGLIAGLVTNYILTGNTKSLTSEETITSQG
ncbi:benzoate/H(+) symporter BenE family transporter [Pelosinus sp. sgz500959]|uniref:benzoate/H(+) symporter BenE family transporter n=1 Tax=Pelosinus sp. sgz500959 TaxID=3242472 RepID=UPI00366A6B9B